MRELTRRAYLLAAIRQYGRPVTTQFAEQLLAGSQWGCHRNTARKDLRAFVRDGHLTAVDLNGRRLYHPTIGEDGRP
jgi:hypothetical protein